MLCLLDSIRQDDPALQHGLTAVCHAQSLTPLLLAGWALACIVAVQVVESVLREWARRPTSWPPCPECGKPLHSKGFAKRQVRSLIGVIPWRRRVGRCPAGCQIGQIAPFDERLGLDPHQRSSMDLEYLGCSLAVFVPYATAARLLSWSSAGSVSARAVWGWTQAAGARAMSRLQAQLAALERGEEPEVDPLDEDLATTPLALSADGVMVPFRPQPKHAKGKTKWREVKVGGLARLKSHTTRTGQVVTRLAHRRLVAVLGDTQTFEPR